MFHILGYEFINCTIRINHYIYYEHQPQPILNQKVRDSNFHPHMLLNSKRKERIYDQRINESGRDPNDVFRILIA